MIAPDIDETCFAMEAQKFAVISISEASLKNSRHILISTKNSQRENIMRTHAENIYALISLLQNSRELSIY
ncbi:hypothetical protein hmeg3_14920 [Herbaspirillum sp. meg3]|jgi:hypothetical protein|uniref:hypothetical protein n=1 Tax=Herbaspirillum sp. meg3 TaxID=2025949 RepID=UPI000B992798|nr:hypothetical protein [Herbaspirillum sp. meg3]ASU39453.1 hypothetical protein hmeg3_14920 [Herbaspirillum sp. meg3]